jgi:hypothetical protein
MPKVAVWNLHPPMQLERGQAEVLPLQLDQLLPVIQGLQVLPLARPRRARREQLPSWPARVPVEMALLWIYLLGLPLPQMALVAMCRLLVVLALEVVI